MKAVMIQFCRAKCQTFKSSPCQSSLLWLQRYTNGIHVSKVSWRLVEQHTQETLPHDLSKTSCNSIGLSSYESVANKPFHIFIVLGCKARLQELDGFGPGVGVHQDSIEHSQAHCNFLGF